MVGEFFAPVGASLQMREILLSHVLNIFFIVQQASVSSGRQGLNVPLMLLFHVTAAFALDHDVS